MFKSLKIWWRAIKFTMTLACFRLWFFKKYGEWPETTLEINDEHVFTWAEDGKVYTDQDK